MDVWIKEIKILKLSWPESLRIFPEVVQAIVGSWCGRGVVAAPFAESPEFQRLLRNDPRPDLLRIALEIARDAYPDLDAAHYLRIIDTLSTRLRERCALLSKPCQVLGQINWVLFVEEGFHGNSENYYDPRNSYLNEVIDRRTGIPISLSVLYWAIAGRLGLELWGVNLPSHFMLRVGKGTSTVFIDPFHGGALLDRSGCERQIAKVIGRPIVLSKSQLAPCGHDLVVARMLRNLKALYLQAHDFMMALPVQERLSALNPGEPAEQRDLGMLYLHVDRPAKAITPLESYLRACPEGEHAEAVRSLLRAARREVASWN